MWSPAFLRQLAGPAVRNVLLCGCGGGFDFVHGLLLVPELRCRGKNVILASYSFGDPDALAGDAPVVFEASPAVVKRVKASTRHSPDYAPEVHVCSYLDERHSEGAPHFVYASYARDFTAGTLSRFYAQLVDRHDVDAVVLMDGGSDSLVVGDEADVGDPVEDAVSIEGVAGLESVPHRMLVVVGLGIDRHNGVSDASSLRAVAELTREGGFLGAVAIERDHDDFAFYRDAVRHICGRQKSHSTVANAVLNSVEGRFGTGSADGREAPDSAFLWPLMGILWAFDVSAVAARSRVCEWVRNAPDPAAGHAAVRAGRRSIPIRDAKEDRLPDSIRSPRPGIYGPDE